MSLSGLISSSCREKKNMGFLVLCCLHTHILIRWMRSVEFQSHHSLLWFCNRLHNSKKQDTQRTCDYNEADVHKTNWVFRLWLLQWHNSKSKPVRHNQTDCTKKAAFELFQVSCNISYIFLYIITDKKHLL